MKRVVLWPSGLVGRVTLVLLAAVLVQFVGAVLLFGEADRLLLRNDQVRRIAEQLVVAERVIAGNEPGARVAVARDLSTRHVRFDWSEEPPADARRRIKQANPFAGEARLWQTELANRDLRVGMITLPDGAGELMAGGLALADGSWLIFQSTEPISRWGTALETVVSVALFAGAVLLIGALLVRTMGEPLRAMANAADQIGFAQPVKVEEQGPVEVRHVAHALNAMQARIAELIASRTQAMAAVSHDLRTPLARLRLRIDALAAGDEADAVRGDIAEMESMLDSLLDFLHAGEDREVASAINLASLIQLVVENAQDMGQAASYAGPDRLVMHIRPILLRRAVTNLVENAVKYGSSAAVTLTATATGAEIAVIDAGPGMSEEAMLHAIEPFYRADDARARDTKGFGLGLAIVDRAVQLHHGTLALANVEPHGLRVTLSLPTPAT